VISFETGVRVERPIEEVFAFVSDPLLFPRWNSAVQTVKGTSGGTGELGSTYSMERELPTGRLTAAGHESSGSDASRNGGSMASSHSVRSRRPEPGGT
jgi:hypothetical protein